MPGVTHRKMCAKRQEAGREREVKQGMPGVTHRKTSEKRQELVQISQSHTGRGVKRFKCGTQVPLYIIHIGLYIRY